IQYFAEQRDIVHGDHAEGFQPACPGGFQVDVLAGVLVDDRVDAEFVRAGVDAQFVRPQFAGDFRVGGEVLLEYSQVTDVIHAFLKTADKSRGQALKVYVQPLQFRGDKIVFRRAGGRIGLID